MWLALVRHGFDLHAVERADFMSRAGCIHAGCIVTPCKHDAENMHPLAEPTLDTLWANTAFSLLRGQSLFVISFMTPAPTVTVFI